MKVTKVLAAINIGLAAYIVVLLFLSIEDIPVPHLRIHFAKFLNYYYAVL